ncbi:MAG: ferredoxin [Bacteroidota bacterium]
MVKVFHYRAKCIGCNACVEADKNRWRMSRKDGKSILIDGTNKKGIYRTEAEADEYKLLMKAVRNCPVKIIRIENSK